MYTKEKDNVEIINENDDVIMTRNLLLTNQIWNPIKEVIFILVQNVGTILQMNQKALIFMKYLSFIKRKKC